MTITLNINPELEVRIREEATMRGMDATGFILDTIASKLQTPSFPRNKLSKEETELLQKINLGFSEKTWQRYEQLITKRKQEALTHQEQKELIDLCNTLEDANAQRMETLAALAALRQMPLEDLMQSLGIDATPKYA